MHSVEYSSAGSLWRYWPERYYQGWSTDLDISTNRPSSKAKPAARFEDLNHAGLTLASICEWELPNDFLLGTRKRLETILDSGPIFPRNMDGRGPSSSTWQLAYGWDCIESKHLKARFSKMLPSAAYGPTLLSYANQFDPKMKFDVTLKLSACTRNSCEQVKQWRFLSPQDYLNRSPFFSIVPAVR